MYIYIRVCVYTYITDICMYRCIYVHVCVYVYIYISHIHVCIGVYMYMCVCIYIQIYHIYIYLQVYIYMCLCVCVYRLPRQHSGKESTCQCKRRKRYRFSPWVRKILWSSKWQPAPVFLPEKFQGQGSLVGYHPWGCK